MSQGADGGKTQTISQIALVRQRRHVTSQRPALFARSYAELLNIDTARFDNGPVQQTVQVNLKRALLAEFETGRG